MENINPNTNIITTAATDGSATRVQHVAKSSSDQLLSKFADSKVNKSSSAKDLRLAKRVKIRSRSKLETGGDTSNSSLLLTSSTSDKPMALIRRLGMSKAKMIRAREIKNKSIITALAKVLIHFC